jgi:hypothetical protein
MRWWALHLCGCVHPHHEMRGCAFAWVLAERGRLYEGLYDGRVSLFSAARLSRVRLLNPNCLDDDPESRRFALLEIE